MNPNLKPGALAKPQKRGPKPRRPIRRRTRQRSNDEARYRRRVKEWLKEGGGNGRLCAVGLLHNETGIKMQLASQCHHKHGRGWRGELLMVEKLWIPVSMAGHQWIDANRDKARELGLLAQKGQWNTMPKE